MVVRGVRSDATGIRSGGQPVNRPSGLPVGENGLNRKMEEASAAPIS